MRSSVQITRGVESLFGTRDENIRVLETKLGIKTSLVESSLEIEGEEAGVSRAERILEDYADMVREGVVFTNGDLNSYLRVVTEDPDVSLRALVQSGKTRNFGKKVLAPKTINQRRYMEAIERNDLVFGIGPAGTGKTYLAVASGGVRAAGQTRQSHYPDASRSRGGREVRLSPGNVTRESRSLSASSL